MASNKRSNMPSNWDRLRRKALRGVKACEKCCGPGPFEVDHIIPRHLGGSNDPDNLQALCHSCHAAKSASEWRARAEKLQQLRRRPRDRHPGESTAGLEPAPSPGGENGSSRPSTETLGPARPPQQT